MYSVYLPKEEEEAVVAEVGEIEIVVEMVVVEVDLGERVETVETTGMTDEADLLQIEIEMIGKGVYSESRTIYNQNLIALLRT